MYINLFDLQDNSVGRHCVGVPDSPSLSSSSLLSNPLAFFAGPWNIQSSVLSLGLCMCSSSYLKWDYSDPQEATSLSLHRFQLRLHLWLFLSSHMTPPPILFLFFVWLACGILFPWPGIEPGPLAVKAWSPNHWVAWKILTSPYFCLCTAFTQTWCKLIFYFGFMASPP